MNDKVIQPVMTQWLDCAVERAARYREAGADCIFVPDTGQLDKQTITSLVAETDAPLNVIAGATTPSIAELESIGVARLTFGPRPLRALLALLRRMAREWKQEGRYDRMLIDSLSYQEVNEMFADGSGRGATC